MPWDLFGQLGGLIDHHENRSHHRDVYDVCRGSNDDAYDDKDGDGIGVMSKVGNSK